MGKDTHWPRNPKIASAPNKVMIHCIGLRWVHLNQVCTGKGLTMHICDLWFAAIWLLLMSHQLSSWITPFEVLGLSPEMVAGLRAMFSTTTQNFSRFAHLDPEILRSKCLKYLAAKMSTKYAQFISIYYFTKINQKSICTLINCNDEGRKGEWRTWLFEELLSQSDESSVITALLLISVRWASQMKASIY